jgi:hypothetical protein
MAAHLHLVHTPNTGYSLLLEEHVHTSTCLHGVHRVTLFYLKLPLHPRDVQHVVNITVNGTHPD